MGHRKMNELPAGVSGLCTVLSESLDGGVTEVSDGTLSWPPNTTFLPGLYV